MKRQGEQPMTVEESETKAREQVAQFMMMHGFATGHGETLTDLLFELGVQVDELRKALEEK